MEVVHDIRYRAVLLLFASRATIQRTLAEQCAMTSVRISCRAVLALPAAVASLGTL
jgi:hypothetical protein